MAATRRHHENRSVITASVHEFIQTWTSGRHGYGFRLASVLATLHLIMSFSLNLGPLPEVIESLQANKNVIETVRFYLNSQKRIFLGEKITILMKILNLWWIMV